VRQNGEREGGGNGRRNVGTRLGRRVQEIDGGRERAMRGQTEGGRGRRAGGRGVRGSQSHDDAAWEAGWKEKREVHARGNNEGEEEGRQEGKKGSLR